PYGVQAGATVSISWSSDLATPLYEQYGPPANYTDYYGAITSMVISIGSWSAIAIVPSPQHLTDTSVGANAPPGTTDFWNVVTEGTDTDPVLRTNVPGALLLLHVDLNEPDGSASSNQSLDQDPAKYHGAQSAGSVVGPGGRNVHFTIDTSGS